MLMIMEYVEFTSLTIGISKIRLVIINFLLLQRMSFPGQLLLEINVTEEILSRTSLEDFEASGYLAAFDHSSEDFFQLHLSHDLFGI